MAKAKATKKKAAAPKKAVKKKAAAPKKAVKKSNNGGLTGKKDFVLKQFVVKGKTKSEAVAGLVKQYPDISINYARTIVYSGLRDADWADVAPTAKKKPAGKATKPTAKKPATRATVAPKAKGKAKAASAKTKATVVEDDEDDDDDDLEDDDDDDDFDF